jgi:hypothetical protein
MVADELQALRGQIRAGLPRRTLARVVTLAAVAADERKRG